MRKHQEKGFSLIETIVASAILSFVLLSLGSLFISLGSLSKKSDYIQFVIELQNELLRSINTLSCDSEADQSVLMSLIKSSKKTVTATEHQLSCNLNFKTKDGSLTLKRNQENLFLFKKSTKDALVLKYNVFAKDGSVYFKYEFNEKSLTSSDPQYASTISVNLSKFKSNRYEVNEYLLRKYSNDGSTNEICDNNSFARTRDAFGILRCIKKVDKFSCPPGEVLNKLIIVRNEENQDLDLSVQPKCEKMQSIKCGENYSPVTFNLQSLTPVALTNSRSIASENKCQLAYQTTSIKEFGPYEVIKASACPTKELFEIDTVNSKCVAERDGDKYNNELKQLSNFDVEKNEFSCSITSEMKKNSIRLKVILACKSKLEPTTQAEVTP